MCIRDRLCTIRLDLSRPAAIFVFAARVLVICQLLSLLSNLLKNAGTIRRTLRPIQELAAAAARLHQAAQGMSPEELQALAGKMCISDSLFIPQTAGHSRAGW